MRLSVAYKPTFVRQFDKLTSTLQEEVLEKNALFRDLENHQALKVHKLHGKLKHYYAFSVNYAVRIVFYYETSNEIVLLAVGNHEVYDA
jgi:mRNA-degrading endonuclease YafQ of YafQ-DinJ toxin-antitoxin module